MSTTVRKPAPRLPRPVVRYWRGKAPKGVKDVAQSDSESEEGEHEERQEEGDVPLGGEDIEVDEDEDEDDPGLPVKLVPANAQSAEMQIKLRKVDISKDGRVIVDGRLESGRTIEELAGTSEEEEDEPEPADRAAQRSASEEASEEESDSEEEEDQPALRPVFIPKRARVTVLEKEQDALDSEEALKKKEMEAEERRKQSHDLVAESLRRELAEKEKEQEQHDVDDTDGLDPTGEFEAWRLRELGRIKRDKEQQMKREEEREEVERRRALPEAQRMKEDLEHANKLREEKPKGQQKFLQKYWHKGAFHQDDEVLKKHDYTEATESTMDVSLLPEVMQVRNFGKRSRTKWTHLVDQDTASKNGGFGGTALLGKPGGGGKPAPGQAGAGCFLCGGPHLKKDCTQNRDRTGANASEGTGYKRTWGKGDEGRADGQSWRDPPNASAPENGGRSRDTGYGRDRDNDRENYRSRDNRRDHGHDDRDRRRDDRRYSDRDRAGDRGREDDTYRSRRRYNSRSPPRERNGDHYAKGREIRRRSRERSLDHNQEGGKRRRVD